jgi:hypothetical protein
MSGVKLSDIVQRFSGGNDEDVGEWLKKVEMVASFQNVPDLAKFVPMFLQGSAFAVYDQLSDEQKASYGEIRKSLLQAYSLTPYEAYEKFKERRLRTDESADGYLADLKGLMSNMGTSDNAMLCCQFVGGLPDEVAAQVKALQGGSMIIADLLACAKQVLVTRRQSEAFSVPVFAAARISTGSAGKKGNTYENHRCGGCGRVGHKAGDCRVRCFRCEKIGHIARNCTGNFSGNGRREAAAFAQAAVSPEEQE